MLCYALLCVALLWSARLCFALLCFARLYFALLSYALLGYVLLCSASFCQALLYLPMSFAKLCDAICYARLGTLPSGMPRNSGFGAVEEPLPRGPARGTRNPRKDFQLLLNPIPKKYRPLRQRLIGENWK